jgi:antitoxin component HigA of HigAB toxin-antitoxin module
MTEIEHKRKLKRLEWLIDRADDLETTIFDSEIEILSNEIEKYEEKEHPIPPPSPHELLKYHLNRTGLKKHVFAERMGISPGWFGQILKGNKISDRMKYKIMNFNYQSL